MRQAFEAGGDAEAPSHFAEREKREGDHFIA